MDWLLLIPGASTCEKGRTTSQVSHANPSEPESTRVGSCSPLQDSQRKNEGWPMCGLTRLLPSPDTMFLVSFRFRLRRGGGGQLRFRGLHLLGGPCFLRRQSLGQVVCRPRAGSRKSLFRLFNICAGQTENDVALFSGFNPILCT